MSTSIDFTAMLRSARKAAPSRARTSDGAPHPALTLALNTAPKELSNYAIASLPGAYIVSWLTREGENALIEAIDGDKSPWHLLTRRRLRFYGGIPVLPTSAVESGAKSSEWNPDFPEWLCLVMKALQDVKEVEFSLNHVLLNEYERGQGIGPHADGPLYRPLACVISLGGPAIMTFKHIQNGKDPVQVLLAQGSLLLFSGEAYFEWTHEIGDTLKEYLSDGTEVLRSVQRLSLTLRSAICTMPDSPSPGCSQAHRQEILERKQKFMNSVSEREKSLTRNYQQKIQK